MPSAGTFKAFLIRQDEGKVASGFVDMTEAELDPGEVTIRVAYSSVNYKDALAATGAGRIIRRYPCIGGIDLSGTVIASADPRFAPGDQVLATSYDIGVAHHGGYAEVARIPANWVIKLPAGLSLRDAMALGTAGFTAALGIVRMEENGLRPANGPVIVTGATGGIGAEIAKTLHAQGAHVVLSGTREANLGGDVLAWIASTMKQGGTIASIGLAASMTLNTTVAPFILRGACLLGIDSGYIGEPYRSGVWRRLASDLRPRHLAAVTHEIGLADLPRAFDDFIQARVKGRCVVTIGGE